MITRKILCLLQARRNESRIATVNIIETAKDNYNIFGCFRSYYKRTGNAAMIDAFEWFLWLMAYSFMGWAYESILCTVSHKKLINRGFLYGPICPVYGFGALVCIFVLGRSIENVFVLFLAGMFLSCTVEYITALLLEKMFGAKWWDYSKYRFNIRGRVSLLSTIIFGLMSVFLIKYIHPFVGDMIDTIPDGFKIVISFIMFTFVMIDLYITVRRLLLLNGRPVQIQSAAGCYLGQYLKTAEELKDSLLSKYEESKFDRHKK